MQFSVRVEMHEKCMISIFGQTGMFEFVKIQIQKQCIKF